VSRPGIGVVVVSYASAAELPACLQALDQAEQVEAIVVVDNASPDASAALVRAAGFPRVQLVEAGRNTGFAGGCNRGLAALPAEIPVVAFCNPDVLVSRDCLRLCAARIESEPALAGVAPRLMRADGETIDSVGQVLDRRLLEVRDRGYGEPISPVLMQVQPVLAACGALAVFRRQALLAVSEPGGPWAEHFFCFWEDLELGWRLNNQGWRIEALPEATATHGRGAGAEAGRGPLRWRRPPALEACVLSNRWLTLIRHLPLLDLGTRLPLLLLWDLLAVTAGGLRRPQLLRHLWRRRSLIVNEWRRRSQYRRRRLHELPCF
jgi:GT2 family glycosyltransferase